MAPLRKALTAAWVARPMVTSWLLFHDRVMRTPPGTWMGLEKNHWPRDPPKLLVVTWADDVTGMTERMTPRISRTIPAMSNPFLVFPLSLAGQ